MSKPRRRLVPTIRELLEERGDVQYSTAAIPQFSRDYDESNPPRTILKSPYYWWFKFLQLNDKYAQTGGAIGLGPYADVYKDLGDVRRTTFRDWWEEHYHLFAEPIVTLRVATFPNQLVQRGDADAVNMVVPLHWNRKKLHDRLDELLDILATNRVRSHTLPSTRAKYQLTGRPQPEAMKRAYKVFQLRSKFSEKISPTSGRFVVSWPEILKMANIPTRPLKPGDDGKRHYENAKALIDRAASRQFPVKTRRLLDDGQVAHSPNLTINDLLRSSIW